MLELSGDRHAFAVGLKGFTEEVIHAGLRGSGPVG